MIESKKVEQEEEPSIEELIKQLPIWAQNYIRVTGNAEYLLKRYFNKQYREWSEREDQRIKDEANR